MKDRKEELSNSVEEEIIFQQILQDSGLAVFFKNFDEFLKKVDPQNKNGYFLNADNYLKQAVGIFSAENVNKKDETPFILPNCLEIDRKNYFDALSENNWQVLKINQRAKVVNWFCEDNNINLMLFPQSKQMISNQKTYLKDSQTLFFGISQLFDKNTPINYLSKILRINECKASNPSNLDQSLF